MKHLFQEAHQAENLYRLILDNALDSFIAIDADGRVLEWNKQAERSFGWRKEEVLGRPLTESIIPERFHEAHQAGLRTYRRHSRGKFLNRRLEMSARCKDGREVPVELTITPIRTDKLILFFASIRDISERRALEETIYRQASITQSILDSMADAVVVADLSGQLILINPAARRLLRMKPAEQEPALSIYSYTILQADGVTEYPLEHRPITRALRGEAVDNFLGMIRHEGQEEGIWISANARPLIDSHGHLSGGVVIFHDITELRRRAAERAQQTQRLQEQAGLLDLALDAIIVRTIDEVIAYWNRSAEKLYGYSREEAIGRHCHELLKTRFPQPLEEIRALVHERRYWEGELIHTARDGREIIVHSRWALDLLDGQPYRYLETNTDITRRIETERELQRSQEDFRQLVEASTDYAIIMIDPEGLIRSWNSGAERIIGWSAQQAIGRSIADLFTSEDLELGEPQRELEEAKAGGRAENNRWHLRADGSRFWATGVMTSLRTSEGVLRGFVKIMRDETQQRLVEEQTQFLANHDALTGLPNRVQFSNQLHTAIAASERSNVPFALLLLDLDRFKYVNDTFGHHAGDLLLKEVALRIQSSIRETDFVARLGGDEFVIIQRDVSQPDASDVLARKLVLEIGRPFQLDTHEAMSGTSVGISLYPRDASNSVELLKRADLALYRAKNAGRHTYQFYTSDLTSEETWRRNREAALRNALEKHQFELYYQPQVDLHHWKISTVEALLRWKATELELVLPSEFLNIAEENGMIVQIGEWAMHQACTQIRKWHAQGLTGLRLSLNCSARQFSEQQFVEQIPAILHDTGVAPSSLELEIPEAMLAHHPEIKERLAALRVLGIRLTIDNFGTGSTALIDFKEFEIDTLKIDKAFVRHLPHRREDSAITSAIINLAHNLGINVVAGGMETAEQLAYLKARDCTGAQGFIFSPPLPPDKFEELMRTGAWSRINAGIDGTSMF